MIIRGGMVLSPKEGGERFERADIRVEETRIAAVGSGLRQTPGEEIVEADGKLVLPGLVNAHYHSYGNLLKGTAWGEPLEIWSQDTVALGGQLDSDAMRLSARLGIAEMLRCGVTACLDHIPHHRAVDDIAEEYSRCGFRAAIAPMIADVCDADILPGIPETEAVLGRRAERPPAAELETVMKRYDGWAQRWHRPEGTLRLLAGINAPQRASDPALRAAREIARQYKIGVHMHLLETRWQQEAARAEGTDPVERIRQAGLLDQNTSLAHCVWLSPRQIESIRDAGCMVVHNPASNLLLGSGRMRLTELVRAGIPVALGSDGANCGTGHDILEQLRLAILLSRENSPDYNGWLTPQEALSLATANGAAVCGWGGQTGVIAQGYLADIVLADETAASRLPRYEPLTQLLLQGRIVPTDIWIHGKRAMRNSKLLCLDEDGLYAEIRVRQGDLQNRFQTALQANTEQKRIFAAAYERQIEKRY